MTKYLTKHLTKYSKSRDLISFILDAPELVSTIEHLEPKILHHLIRHVGLEDSGELIALATTEQLKNIFDDDLWNLDQPGQTETFDKKRFTLWLEIMNEMGPAFTAKRLIEMDEDFVTFALSQYIIVINLASLNAQMWQKKHRKYWDENDLIDRALESSLSHEFGDYLIIAKKDDGWNTILEILLELDSEYYDFAQTFFDRCSYLSSDFIEENGGLYNVLNPDETLESDVASDREERREEAGFIAPAIAAGFLALAEQSKLEDLIKKHDMDYVSKTYFRNYQQSKTVSPETPQPLLQPSDLQLTEDISTKKAYFLNVLKKAGVIVEEVSRPLGLENHQQEQSKAWNKEETLKQALSDLFSCDLKIYEERLSELNYLANILIAACKHDGLSFRPLEATRATMCVATLGLNRLLEEEQSSDSCHILTLRTSIELFQIGINILYNDVILYTAKTLEKILYTASDQLEYEDLSSAKQLIKLARMLKKNISSQKPWHVINIDAEQGIDALNLVFDIPTVDILKGLLERCPCVPAHILNQSGNKLKFIAHQKEILFIQNYIDRLSL